ncbi:MAG: C25 family cysteine peptidase [Bacteroidetes bacterium]|nr:C25 family cysteine peptidase [Bacteroidota bacterium]
MKKLFLFLTMFIATTLNIQAQQFTYRDVSGKPGMNIVDSKPNGVEVVYSIPDFSMEDLMVNGAAMKSISLPGTFLFNDEGMPNLPGKGGYIAIPQGATAKLRIVSQRTDVIHNVEIAPAPRIPLENDNKPLSYTPNPAVYSQNAFYPANPAQISSVTKFRGVDVVMLGLTPFQYNPVTKDLIVYKELNVTVDFEGGNGHFGEDAYRNAWWDPILQDNIMNCQILPTIDYNARLQSLNKSALNDECEYIIISPTGPDFQSWADSIRRFRLEQGILTKVFTVDAIGGNTTTAIEAFIDNAYNTWTIKPVACLMLGDYGADATKNLISPLLPHPDGYPNFASDNKYADVTNDQLPDVVFARITANDATQLQIMCSKFLSYERNPPTDPVFYDKPITALGWQTERWFQLCSEIVGGYFRNTQNKHPRRINAIYQGTPGSTWSSATNTTTVVNYFGPNGLNYIPQTPAEMPCCWNGGTATQINQAIDSGAFMLMHRDHGNYTEWGEPAYSNSWAIQLNNTNLTFIFSINCETGAYHRSSDCLGEKFHRQFKNGHNAGSMGFVAPTETSYSFVNDTFVWGMMDNMFADFMPAEYTFPASRGFCPAFGHAAGKYFLQRSNWPYNTGNKVVTYQMFHMHGDAYMTLYSEVPEQLDVTHAATINYGATSFEITANDSAFIALTSGDELLATGYGSASGPVSLAIPVIPVGSQIKVTVTKRNFFRYSDFVTVTSENLIANFSASQTNICVGATVNYNDLSTGNPISWQWEFQGGSPATSNAQNPSGITYTQSGSYDVKLTVSKATGDPVTVVKTAYIAVTNLPAADFTDVTGCPGLPVEFSDASIPNGGTITNWKWIFGDPASGINDTAYVQNPTHTFNDPGAYPVSLEVIVNGLCQDIKLKDVTINTTPAAAAKPTGQINLCKDATGTSYLTAGATGAATYNWLVEPEAAGTISDNGTTGTLVLTSGFLGTLTIKVQGTNDCGNGVYSEDLTVAVIDAPGAPVKPVGADSLDLNKVSQSDFTISEIPGAVAYSWTINPSSAGTISGTGLTGTVNWSSTYRGGAAIVAKATNTCGESVGSEEKAVKLYSTVGIAENEGNKIEVTPNPNNGRFYLDINAGFTTSVSIIVYNTTGVAVYSEKEVKVSGKLHKNLDLSNLPKCVYLLKVEGSGISNTISVVIGR